MMSRPIYGGPFGMGRYALASMPCVSRGLHATRYMVIDPTAGAVLSVSEDKTEALATARRVLRASHALARGEAEAVAINAGQGTLFPELAHMPFELLPRRPVSKRRRVIFEKSEGRCHYCSSVLTLDGKWHVEHMLPRALGGADEPDNLVAACVPCNLAKRDRTAVEFVADSTRPVPR